MMIKIMIVGNNHLSINQLKSQMSWADYGYQIITETPSGELALENFMRIQPDIVLIDIQRPVKDELTVAKEILALDFNTKIILISDCEEFHYAKACLDMGIDNYLVKHEITQEILLSALNSAKAKIEKVNEYNGVLKREHIRKVIEGKYAPAAKNQAYSCFNEDIGQVFLFFLVQHDTPLPINIRETESTSKFSELNDEFFKSVSIGNDKQYICCIYITKTICGVLFKITNHISRRHLMEFNYYYTQCIQTAYTKKHEGTISVVVTDLVKSVADLRISVMENLKYLQLSYYGFRGKLITTGKNTKFKKRPTALILRYLYKFESALSKKMFEAVKDVLEKLFYYDGDSYIELSELNQICIWLSSIIAQFVTEHHLVIVREQFYSMQSGLQAGYDVEKTLEWYTKLCDCCIEAAKNISTLPITGKIKEVIAYINAHYADEITINDTAELFSMSGEYLRHLFKDTMNQNFVDYLNMVRIEKSKAQLIKGNYNISEIAKMCGYSSSQYYSNVFRKYTLMSPKEFVKCFFENEKLTLE